MYWLLGIWRKAWKAHTAPCTVPPDHLQSMASLFSAPAHLSWCGHSPSQPRSPAAGKYQKMKEVHFTLRHLMTMRSRDQGIMILGCNLNKCTPEAQTAKNLPAMRETQVWSLGREDPLGKEMATLSSILAWEIPWTEEVVGYSSWVAKRHDWATKQQQSHHTNKAAET